MKMPNFDFYKNRKLYFLISAAILVVAVVFALFFGLKVDIKFTGGSIITYSYEGDVDAGTFQSTIEAQTGSPVTVTSSTNMASGEPNFVVNFSETDGLLAEEQTAILDSLQETFPDNNIASVSVDNVSATMGRDFLLKCLVAVFFAALFMVIYIAFRFKRIGGWSAGVCAVIALLHDLAMVFATFILFRLSLDSNFIAVLLVILGYSINATIIIYDRIRENRKLYGNTVALPELVNMSINQTLPRTINTTISTILAMVAVAVMALIFNVSSILTFAFPLIIGLIAGTYSSTCISGPLWVIWQQKRLANKAKKHR